MSAPPALRTPSPRHPSPSPSLPSTPSRARGALRRLWLLLVVALVAATGGAVTGAGPAAAAGTATFTPGAAWQDTAGGALQLHGLGIVKAGSTWYGFGENKAGESSSNAAFQSVACYSSADLAHWTRQNDALTRQSSGDLGPNRVVERPKVLFNASTGLYVMYLHIDSSSYGEAKVGVATSSTPCGPYSYRGSFQPLGQQSRDIGLFQDTDGSAYLLTEDRANGLRIDRLSADYLSVTSSVHVFGDYEAPAMVKADGRYYLFGSSLTGWSTNDNVYATATSLTGTWSAFRPVAPVGTHTYDAQTANVIPVAGSGGTAYVFAADRWTTADLGSSPEVWLPLTLGGGTAAVSWQNSWTLDTAAGTWTGTSDPADATYRITAAHSGKRLDVKDAATADGSAVEQWSANSGTNQQWTLHRVAGSTYTVTGTGSGKPLDVPGGSTAAGTRLDIRGADGSDGQRWVLQATGGYTSASNSSYVLVNLGSGLVADVVSGSTADGALVEQWDANGGGNQTWSLG